MAKIDKRPTSKYFNNYFYTPRQELVENLILQAIRMHGIYVYYIPRENFIRDNTFGDDTFTKFDDSIEIEVYVRTVDAFEGQGDFLSKFDLQIEDQIVFTFSRKRWNELVAEGLLNSETREKPKAGDLIYLPIVEKLFEITHVEHENLFYQHGKLMTYDLRCELFKYSHEEFETGWDEIDSIQTQYSGDTANFELLLENGSNILLESGDKILLETYRIEDTDYSANNELFQVEGEKIIDFGERSPFLKASKW